MRISIPTIPASFITPTPTQYTASPSSAIARLAEFISPGNVAVITGAGVSVDSGIRAYRGRDGRYMNPNYKPILYHELVDLSPKGYAYRQRYWLRSYLGYPPVLASLPNPTHYALAALQYSGHIKHLITQNVDELHLKALRLTASSTNYLPLVKHKLQKLKDEVLELHGTLHKVRCSHHHIHLRETFQSWIASSNPKWATFMDDLERNGKRPRTNPDGDVVLEGVSYDDFVVPECPTCLEEGRQNSFHKPDLIFFGESISPEVKKRSFLDIESADRVLIIGTTLATFSAFRLLRHALELHKPVLILNVGPTRAEDITDANLEKIELPTSVVMRDTVRAVLGTRADTDPVIVHMLSSGIVKPPPESVGDERTTSTSAGEFKRNPDLAAA